MIKEDHIFVLLVLCCISFFLGGCINGYIVAESYKTSAVKAGVGERIVDEDGNVEFKWKQK